MTLTSRDLMLLIQLQQEKMLDTVFHYYTHDADGSKSKKIRTLNYSIPQSLTSDIALIEPTTRFGQLKPQRSAPFEVIRLDTSAPERTAARPATPGAPLDVTACNATITPECLRALYNIGDYYATPVKGSLFGVAGYLNQYAKYAPLDAFLKKYAPYAVSQSFDYQLINGGKNTQNDTIDDDVEANLDIQACGLHLTLVPELTCISMLHHWAIRTKSGTTALEGWDISSQISINLIQPTTRTNHISNM